MLGMLEGALALLAFFTVYWSAGWRPGMPMESSGEIYAQATTLTYMAIVMAQVGVAFASRTRRSSVFRIGLFTNRALVVGTLLSVVLMLALVYIKPLAALFNFVPPQPEHWVMLACFPGYRARIRNHGHSCFLCEIVIRSQFHTTYEPEA
jgi:Cation transporting ATPase, C-terminus.